MKYMKPLSLYQELLKSPALERGRLLGLDVGDKYVGLAVSDFNNKIVSPLRYDSPLVSRFLLFCHIELSFYGYNVTLPSNLCFLLVYNKHEII